MFLFTFLHGSTGLYLPILCACNHGTVKHFSLSCAYRHLISFFDFIFSNYFDLIYSQIMGGFFSRQDESIWGWLGPRYRPMRAMVLLAMAGGVGWNVFINKVIFLAPVPIPLIHVDRSASTRRNVCRIPQNIRFRKEICTERCRYSRTKVIWDLALRFSLLTYFLLAEEINFEFLGNYDTQELDVQRSF